MDLKKYRNRAEMKECKNTTLHIQKYTADVGYTLNALFHICLVSVHFLGPSLLEMKFY